MGFLKFKVIRGNSINDHNLWQKGDGIFTTIEAAKKFYDEEVRILYSDGLVPADIHEDHEESLIERIEMVSLDEDGEVIETLDSSDEYWCTL